MSVTIPGDTAGGAIGQGLTTEGLRLNIPLLCGADNAKAAGSWGGGIYEAASSTPNLLDNTANNIYLGDVQLEVGSVATDFEHEPISVTFAKCLRYYFELAGASQIALPTGSQTATSGGSAYYQYPVEMRTTPALAYSDLSHFGVQPDMVQQNPDAITLSYGTASSAWIACTFSADAAKNLTYRFYTLSADARLNFSADL